MLIAAAARDSATPATQGENEDYSEWRLFLASVRGVGFSFENVVVNDGFRNQDFQTKQGVVSSVIDPELLGKLRKEAADIWNTESYGKRHLHTAVMLVPCLCLSLLFLGQYLLGQRPFAGVILDSIIVFSASFIYMMISGICVSCCVSAKTDARAVALVESYHPTFLQEYGIELGYGKFKVSPEVEDSPICPCIYLRRSQQLVDDEEAPVVGPNCNDMDPFSSPIYVTRLIPGEISIEEKYDAAALMNVDADAWSLLQTTHQRMTRWNSMLEGCSMIILGVGLLPVFALLVVTPYFGFVNMWIFSAIVDQVYGCAVDNQDLRMYEKVTEVVNSALQKDKKKEHLALEFHDSESPGREGKLGRRYQFVPRAEQPIPVWKVCKVVDGNLV